MKKEFTRIEFDTEYADTKLSMLRKSFVFNCPEGATSSGRSL